MGQHLVTHDPCDPSDFRDPFDPWPIDPFPALIWGINPTAPWIRQCRDSQNLVQTLHWACTSGVDCTSRDLHVLVVPVMDESHLVRMQLAEDGMAPGMSGGRPVAVIVLQDGTELHFFQFIDSDDESSDNEQRWTSQPPLYVGSKPHFMGVNPPLYGN